MGDPVRRHNTEPHLPRSLRPGGRRQRHKSQIPAIRAPTRRQETRASNQRHTTDRNVLQPGPNEKYRVTLHIKFNPEFNTLPENNVKNKESRPFFYLIQYHASTQWRVLQCVSK